MNLKIWHKMIIGISIPSIIAVIGGLLTYEYVNDVKIRHGFVQVADDLKERFLEVRQNEKIFLHYKNAEYFNNLNVRLSSFTSSLDNISPNVIKEIGSEDIITLRQTIRKYSGHVNRLYENFMKEYDVVENLRADGRELEEVAKSGKHSDAVSINFILNLRRLEKNYMLFRGKESYDNLDRELSQLLNAVPSCNECAQYAKAIHELFSIYEKINSTSSSLHNTGNEIEKITSGIVNRERQHISAFFTSTQRILLSALILLCTLGPFLVYKTATHIVAPIKRLTEITRKISDGDLTVRAPLKEHDETYSLAQSFNTMLDNLQLTHESLERSLELLHEKQKEVEKCASIGFIASGVAHELNNPLGVILGFTDILIEKAPPDSQEHELLKTIEKQSIRAKRVVENLLSFARYSEHKEGIVDINKSISSVLSLIANTLLMNKISLEQHLQENLPSVKGCDEELQQVFFNISNNAISAMKGGGTLTISTRLIGNRDVEIRFADTGKGINTEHRKKIFEPLFTTKKTGEGTGLGLSVSHDIITKHDGTIRFETKTKDESSETGTTFIITLPIINSPLSPSS